MLETLLPFPKEKAAELLRSEETLASVLLLIILTAYKDEVFGNEEVGIEPIDPIELWTRLEEDFHAQIPVENENRLNALMLAVSTDGFFDDPEIFKAVTLALNSGDMGDLVSGQVEELTLPEALWAIFEVELNRDDDIELAAPVSSILESLMHGESIAGQTEDKPYYVEYVESMKKQLHEQLEKLELPHDQIVTFLHEEETTPQSIAG